MLRAIAAAESQTMSHRSAEGWLAARTAAARPMAPMPAPPRPGTAVNVELRSIVLRMNRRFSSACWPTEGTAAGSPARRDIFTKRSAHPGMCQRALQGKDENRGCVATIAPLINASKVDYARGARKPSSGLVFAVDGDP